MIKNKARFMVMVDSHTSFFSGENSIVSDFMEVELFGMNFHIHHLGPVLASSLVERQSTLMAREKILNLLRSADPAEWTAIIFSLGEIDCRYHIIKRPGPSGRRFYSYRRKYRKGTASHDHR